MGVKPQMALCLLVRLHFQLHYFESWKDCGDDGLCAGDEGYPGPDSGEGNGKYSRAKRPFRLWLDRLCPEDEGYTGPMKEADGGFQASWLRISQQSPCNGGS